MTSIEPDAAATPLVSTKLHPPRRRRTLVDRPRLHPLAARASHRALTLVSAPAGFGKTTLVADWFSGDRTAWLSLDQRDDDPERFWTYVLAALEGVAPDLSTDATALLRGRRSPLETVVATLINDLERLRQVPPRESEDFAERDGTGRHVSVKAVRPVMIRYWLDGAVNELRIVGITIVKPWK